MDEFCRGCLNNFNDPLELLQYTEERRRLFVYSTGLQVKRNDAFTFQLCKECYFSMKTSCKFKKMCRTSDRKIKSYLALKDVDEGMDFSSFLKKHEETLTFRLPLLSGNSTPATQKAQDDDNVSTCTSIQNFMTDILRADEIPDSEARIIREVIEEEADVLEDSLDSHWLQDDASINSDFQLDISFSKFSTPHSTNHDRMASEPREVTSTDITSGEDYDNIPLDSALKKSTIPVESSYTLQNVLGTENELNKKCVIDKNLEKALRNENNKEFSLEEILASPSAFQPTSAASTPTIRHILFGDKLDDMKKVKSPNFESDLDLLLGKFEKGHLSEGKLSKRKSIGSEMPSTDKVVEESKVLQNHMKLTDGSALGGNQEENLHTSTSKLQEKHNAIHFYNENLNKQLITIKKEKLHIVNIEKPKISSSHKDNTEIEKLQMGKFIEDTVDMENFKMSPENFQKIDLNKEIDNSHDSKVDLTDLSIGMLLKGDSTDKKIKILSCEKFYHGKQFEMLQNGKSIKSVDKSPQSDNTTDEILKEFLENDHRKLCDTGKKGKGFASLQTKVPIDDEELTELLEDAYDRSASDKGKKSINYQSPPKYVETLNTHSNLTKKTLSPLEKKYCITNFYCKMCHKKFKNLVALKVHFKKCHKFSILTPRKPREYRVKMCDHCGKTFAKKEHLIRHIEGHENPQEFSCKKCTLKFSTQNALKTHMSTHTARGPIIQSEKIGKYVCAICGAISSSSSNLVMHQRRHTKSYTVHCSECGKGFYRNTELATHMRHHTGEKPFKCTYCDASFSRRDILNRHMKCHTAEKPFSCQECNKTFARNNELKKHQMNTGHKQLFTVPMPVDL